MAEQSADCLPHDKAEPAELQKSESDRKINTGADQEDQHRYSPDNVVETFGKTGNELHRRPLVPVIDVFCAAGRRNGAIARSGVRSWLPPARRLYIMYTIRRDLCKFVRARRPQNGAYPLPATENRCYPTTVTAFSRNFLHIRNFPDFARNPSYKSC